MFTIRHDKNARHCKWSYDADVERAATLPATCRPNLHPAPQQQLGSSISVLRPSIVNCANGLASDALHFDIVVGANHDTIGRRQVNPSAG
jgi:hypothetical protein